MRLATSELVTNVVSHTTDGGELRAGMGSTSDVPLRLEVEDPDPAMPSIPDEFPAIGGRGLGIVDEVPDNWESSNVRRAKVVWAEFDRNQRDGSPTLPEAPGGR